jgi:hypothetical protein
MSVSHSMFASGTPTLRAGGRGPVGVHRGPFHAVC